MSGPACIEYLILMHLRNELSWLKLQKPTVESPQNRRDEKPSKCSKESKTRFAITLSLFNAIYYACLYNFVAIPLLKS